jgi:hypothetical protein
MHQIGERQLEQRECLGAGPVMADVVHAVLG